VSNRVTVVGAQNGPAATLLVPPFAEALKASVPVVGFVSILGFQKHAELYNFGAHTSAIGFQPVDHAAIARAVGATGLRITGAADLGPALEKALAADSVTLLDVMTDPDAYPPITAWAGREDVLLQREVSCDN
jgi:acetolactate synthase-1/2/3 large subunit